MIQELAKFVADLEQNDPFIHQKGVELREGLYLFVEINEDGSLSIIHKLLNDKKVSKAQIMEEQELLYRRSLALQQVLMPVAPTKIFNPIEKIFGVTCSSFALGFNKKNIDKNSIEKIQKGLVQYFDKAKEFLDSDDDILKNKFLYWHNTFSGYCKHNLVQFLEKLEEYQQVKEGGDFLVMLILNEPNIEYFKIIHDVYFHKNIFNKEEYNKADKEGLTRGVPDSLYTYNVKKPFLQHQSSPFNLKYRTSISEAKLIWQFYELQKRVLPNPLPIFIDNRELNKEVVTLFSEDKKENYTDIIKALFTIHKEDLGGYYLLFSQKGSIIDLDFVPSFQYHLHNCELRETACLNCSYINKEKQSVEWPIKGKITNLFDFQEKVANHLLGVELETNTKGSKKWLKYFGEVEYNPKYMTDIQYNIFLKYRLSFYNYIYKSQRNAINKVAFDDIMVNSIMDDLRHDEVKESRHTKQYDVKEKILIWFSLYDFFEQNKKNSNDMINLTQQLFDELKNIAKSSNAPPTEVAPELFAFASGQVIREILQKSKSDKRSHALLEPFLQKTDVNLFKLAIARAFETYKHEFTLYSSSKRYEFDRTMSLIMGASDNSINVKDLLPFTLAGYFSDSIFVKDQVNQSDSENNGFKG